MRASDNGVCRADQMVRGYPLVGLLAAGAAGIEVDYRLAVAPVAWGMLLAVALVGWWWLWHARRDRAAAWAVFFLTAALGGVWHHDRWFLFGQDELARFAHSTPTSVCLQAIALDVPGFRPAAEPSPLDTMAGPAMSRLPIQAKAVLDRGTWRAVSGRAMVTVPGRLPAIARGDRLRIVGDLYRIEVPQNPGGTDYAALARSQRQLCFIACRHTVSVRVVSFGWRLNPLRWPGQVRYWARRVLWRHVGAGEAPLAAALILGERSGLDAQTVETFFFSGTLHMLAISGLHVGILAMLFWFLLRLEGWSRPGLLFATVSLVVGYAAITGMRTPVLRATVLVSAYCLARAVGRRGNPWNLLAAAGLFTLAVRPAALRAPGAQLSFLAVATIIRVWPLLRGSTEPDPLDRLIQRSRHVAVRFGRAVVGRCARVLALSTVVWLVSAPLVAARFHLLAPTAIPLNLVMWFPVAVAMFAGVLTLLTAVAAPPVASIFGLICAGALRVTYAIAYSAASWSGGHRWLAGPPWWWIAILYLGIAVCTATRWPTARRWRWSLLVAWLCVGLVCGSAYQRAWHAVVGRSLFVTFISVGHGTCVLIELPDGRNIVYDAGRMGNCDAAAAPISGVLWYRNIWHVDALILSHADVDHFNAVPTLLKRFSVGGVYVSPVMFRHQPPAVKLLHQAIDDAHVAIREIQETDRFEVGRAVRIEVLHPPPAGCGSSDNSNSVVLSVQYGPHRVLLAGDLEGAGLRELLSELECHFDVVMAPHHGSLHSNPEEVVAWSSPRFVIVSDALHRSSEEPGGGAYYRAAQVIHTGRQGACQVRIDPMQLEVRTWQPGWTRFDPQELNELRFGHGQRPY